MVCELTSWRKKFRGVHAWFYRVRKKRSFGKGGLSEKSDSRASSDLRDSRDSREPLDLENPTIRIPERFRDFQRF